MKFNFLEESLKKGGSIYTKKEGLNNFTDKNVKNIKRLKFLNGGALKDDFSYKSDYTDSLELALESSDSYGYMNTYTPTNVNTPKLWLINNPFDPTNLVSLPELEAVPLEIPIIEDTPKEEETPFKINFIEHADYSDDLNYLEHSEKPISVNENTRKVFDFFINKGLTPELASGFVGNFLGESVNMNTNSINELEKAKGKKGYGRGIALWSNSRIEDFKRVEGISPEKATLEQQLDFAWHEIKQRPVLMSLLKKSKTLDEATELVYRGFENGSKAGLATPKQLHDVYSRSWEGLGIARKYNYADELKRRINKASNYLKQYKV